MAKLIDKNLEREILREIEKNNFITREKLIDILYKRHKELNKIKVAEITLIRYIRSLRDLKQIVLIDRKEYGKFSIRRSDKRNVYLTVPSFLHSFKHIGEVLKTLQSSNRSDQERALLEIETLDMIKLAPVHLLLVISLLPKKQSNIAMTAVRVLFKYVENKIYPDDKNLLEENLAKCLEVHKESLEKTGEHNQIIALLGILSSINVIKFLKEDIEKDFDQEKLRHLGYMNWHVANIIVQHSTDLFNFEENLNSPQRVNLVTVRRVAEKNLYRYRNNIIEYQELLETEK